MSNEDFGMQVYKTIKGMRGYATKLTRDSDRADDLMQDTICRALRYRHKFEPGTSIVAWLTVVMRNTFLESIRTNGRFVPLSDATAESIPHPYDHKTAEDRIELQQRLSELAPLALAIIVDVSVRPMRYADAAVKYGIPVETVKSRVLRTRRGEYHAGDRSRWRRKLNAVHVGN